MSQGYAGAFAHVVDMEAIRKNYPEIDEAYKTLQENVENSDMFDCMEDFARDYDYGWYKMPLYLKRLYNDFINTVNEKTGLDVNIAFHDSEQGSDIYNEVDGVYWYADNYLIVNPELPEESQKLVDMKTFVQYS